MNDLKFVKNTCSGKRVHEAIKKTMQLKNQDKVSEIKNWDEENPSKYNSLFIHKKTGLKWVIYLPDHAYQGEVKIIKEKA